MFSFGQIYYFKRGSSYNSVSHNVISEMDSSSFYPFTEVDRSIDEFGRVHYIEKGNDIFSSFHPDYLQWTLPFYSFGQVHY